MFNIKKVRKPGQCSAMRCLERSDDLLCPRHLGEWQAAGQPALTASTALATTPAETGLLPKQVEDALSTERPRAQEVLALLQSLPLDTTEQLDFAGSLMKQASDRVKELEKERTSVTGPLNNAIRIVNGWFRPVRELYESCEKTLQERIQERLQALQAGQDAALDVIQEQGVDAPAEAFATAHAPIPVPEGIKVQDKWEYTVVDFARLPDRYKLVNDQLIKAELREHGGDVDIPGIRLELAVKVGAK